MDKVRVGIIGLGIGQLHYGGYSASPNADLVAQYATVTRSGSSTARTRGE